ncbi:glycosyltransferase family 2 protein [Nocardia crassostreae]|uniref:glycosyltransferase family 2 protein n=1 Tax=Nocardia crassostreae TaxID=53428 RepID=UPI00082B2512|nr:glycosyltransferase family 2 protein [Nocardia crassostreae]
MLSLTVVVPCLDEADTLRTAHQAIAAELGAHDLEMVFVDDGSTDATLHLMRELAAKDPRVHYISFARRFGFEAAFAAGYKYAAKEWVLYVDADLQGHPAEAHRLIAAASDHVDAVLGVRDHRADPPVRRWGSTLSELIARRLLRIELPRGGTTFRLVRTGVARRVVELRRPAPYFMATLPRITSRYVTVRTPHRPRRAGRSKFTVARLAGHALDLYVAHSTVPGAVATALSAAATITALAALALLGATGYGVALTALLIAQLALLPTAALLLRHSTLAARRHGPALYYVRKSDLPIEHSDRLSLERAEISGGAR